MLIFIWNKILKTPVLAISGEGREGRKEGRGGRKGGKRGEGGRRRRGEEYKEEIIIYIYYFIRFSYWFII